MGDQEIEQKFVDLKCLIDVEWSPFIWTFAKDWESKTALQGDFQLTFVSWKTSGVNIESIVSVL